MNSGPIAAVSATDNSICAEETISLLGSASGGASPYSYSWSGPNNYTSTDQNPQILNATNQMSGLYNLTTTDNGCVSVQSMTYVYVISLPIIGAGPDQTVCDGASVTLAGSGATSYSWNNNVDNGVSFVPTSTTTYTVTGTDANGCQNTDDVTITVNASPQVDAGSDQTVCYGANVTLSGSGASNYTWDNGITDNAAFTATATTTYTVTGTDGNNCSETDQVTVTVNALPTVSAGSDQTVCDGTDVTLAGSGASTYAWDNGVIDNTSFTATATTTYTVTGSDANGCQNTDDVTMGKCTK